jgi:hypothetical protein
MYVKKCEIYHTIRLQIIFILNMLIFNFHKMMDMHKGYTYQFSHFIPT